MALTVAGRDSYTPEILGKNSGRSGLVRRITFVVMYSKRERMNVVCVCAHISTSNQGGEPGSGGETVSSSRLDTFPTMTV